MPEISLTSEQQAVIQHPPGHHARVLAVAGSGKTITMAYRIRHLVMYQDVNPKSIRVLMFNRLARGEFQQRLNEAGVPQPSQPPVHTFHSFCYQLIGEMQQRGRLPASPHFWGGSGSERAHICVLNAIRNLERKNAIPEDSVDSQEALEAIRLWKASLIPPPRAGYRGNPNLPPVYAEFERLRMQAGALTYADFVPLVVEMLRVEDSLRAEWCNTADHVIVDEYQDVNYGQQRLIELVAGQRADVMVVGDDDQTIYEWRGARPNYIIREFRSVFSNKPHTDYQLSRSFRFGPVIAQCAHNVISFNTTRVEKPLLAHFAAKPADVHLVEDSSEQPKDVHRELTDQVVALVRGENVHPRNIVVLARMFAQLSGLESEFLSRRIPYKVLGRAPFFERAEIVALLNYVRVAVHLDDPVSDETQQRVLSIANKPSRFLPRKDLTRVLVMARRRNASIRQALAVLSDDPRTTLNRSQRTRVAELVGFLDRVGERVSGEPNLLAGDLLDWVVQAVDYLSHFDDYYGAGEESFDRKRAVLDFVRYATGVGLRPLAFVEHVEELDTTQGVPEGQEIIMTTVFRVKGLEYDYVIIPQCQEGYMPCLYATGNRVFDTEGLVEEPEPSEAIENERRLFYVAITRAREAVFIGASLPPKAGQGKQSSPNLPSRFLDEVELEPTSSVMREVQRLAAGAPGADKRLLQAVKRFGGARRVLRNLSGYLSDIGAGPLLGRIMTLAQSEPEVPFSYRYAYSSPEIAGRKKAEPERLDRAWHNLRFG